MLADLIPLPAAVRIRALTERSPQGPICTPFFLIVMTNLSLVLASGKSHAINVPSPLPRKLSAPDDGVKRCSRLEYSLAPMEAVCSTSL